MTINTNYLLNSCEHPFLVAKIKNTCLPRIGQRTGHDRVKQIFVVSEYKCEPKGHKRYVTLQNRKKNI